MKKSITILIAVFSLMALPSCGDSNGGAPQATPAPPSPPTPPVPPGPGDAGTSESGAEENDMSNVYAALGAVPRPGTTTESDALRTGQQPYIYSMTPVKVGFADYLSLDESATPGEVEAKATEVITEIFNEPGMAQGKVWQIQQVVGQMQEQGLYSEEDNRRVRILTAGIHHVVNNNEMEAIAEDVLVMAGISVAIAVVGAKGDVLKDKLFQMSKAVGRGISNAAVGTKNTAKKLVSKDTYAASGQRVGQMFKTRFKGVPPEETLSRNMVSLGLDEKQLGQLGNFQQISKADFDQLGVKLHETALRKVSAAAVDSGSTSKRWAAYFVFSQKQLGKTRYFKSNKVSESQSKEIYDALIQPKEARHFYEIASEGGKLFPTRAQVGTFVKGTGNGVKNLAQNAGSGVKHAAQNAGSGIKHAAQNAGSGVKNVAQNAGSGVKSAAAATGSGIKRATVATGSGIKKATVATGSGIKRATVATGNGIKNAAVSTKNGVKNFYTSGDMRTAGTWFVVSFASLGTGYYFGRDTEKNATLSTQHLYELEERIIRAIEVAEVADLK